MTYRVIITPTAAQDLRIATAYIRRDSPIAARRWLKQIKAHIATLSRLPERRRLAAEASSFNEPIRELLFGSGNRGTYRILFILIEVRVEVLHVRHGSMLPLGAAPDDDDG